MTLKKKKKHPVTTKHKCIVDQIFGTTSSLVIQIKGYRTKHGGQRQIWTTFDGWLQTRWFQGSQFTQTAHRRVQILSLNGGRLFLWGRVVSRVFLILTIDWKKNLFCLWSSVFNKSSSTEPGVRTPSRSSAVNKTPNYSVRELKRDKSWPCKSHKHLV